MSFASFGILLDALLFSVSLICFLFAGLVCVSFDSFPRVSSRRRFHSAAAFCEDVLFSPSWLLRGWRMTLTRVFVEPAMKRIPVTGRP